MAWFCSLCYRSRSFVLAAKFATVRDGLQVGDICLTCLREKAEEDIGMEKYDSLEYWLYAGRVRRGFNASDVMSSL